MVDFDVNAPWAPTDVAADILLTNASLVDVRKGEVRQDTTIRISNGKIAEVCSGNGSKGGGLSDQIAIDLQGKYVMPGLCDNHTHVTGAPGGLSFQQLYHMEPSSSYLRTAYVLKTMLLRGFTSVRDTGGADAGLRSAIAEGLIPGPRLIIAGKALSQTGGHADFRDAHDSKEPSCCSGIPNLGRVCDGVPACLAAARDELRRGSDFIKIMGGGGFCSPNDPLHMVQYTAEEIKAITTTASFMGTYATVHAYTPASIRHAVENGARGIEHGSFIDAETAKFCVEKGVMFTPTLGVYEAFRHPPFNATLIESNKKKLEEIVSKGQDGLKILKDLGAKVCYGSDLLGGTHYQQNSGFGLLSEVFSPAEILRMATINCAEPMRLEGQLGVVEEGYLGDVLVLDKNPLQDIASLTTPGKTILAIIKDGRVVKSCLDGLQQDSLYRSF